MSMKHARLVAVGLVILTMLTQPSVARAAEIKVLCSNGIRAVMEELIPQFEQATKHKVLITYGLSAALKRQIEAGEAFDIAVLTPALVDDLIKQGKIAGDTRTVLARAGMAIAIRAGAPRADIRTTDALKRTLLASKSIAYAKEGAGGVFFADLAQRLGIADTLKSKIKLTTTGDEVGAAVARGDAELGVLPLSEVLTIHGVEVLGTFPADVQGYAVMVAGASVGTRQGAAAKELIKFVTAPAALPVIKKKGMESVTPWPAAAQQPEVATLVAFTEGPTVDRAGNVYFTDIINQRIMKLSSDGVLSTYREHSNAANGLVIDPQGRLIACEGAEFVRPGLRVKGKPQVTRTDLTTGKIEVLAENYQGKPLQGPNDVTIDGKGRLYFTDPAGTAVYRIDAPGKLTRILAAPDIQRPNGIQISPDDTKLYLIEANPAQGGARMIRSYDLQPDGTVRNMRVHYNFYPGRSADGMSIDTQGNLYASAGMNQPRGSAETIDTKTGVYVISPQGKLLKFIPIAEDLITNNAFGGPDMKTLYVTAGKTLYKVRIDIAGLPR